jgi:hypothetical protein
MEKYHRPPILPMKDGIERKIMTFILENVKQVKGLTSFITKVAGINGKWLNVSIAYDFSSERLIRIILYKAIFQGREAFMKDIEKFVDKLYEWIKEEESINK